MERSYVMLKPGALQRRIVGEIISRFEKKGLTIQAMKMMTIPKETAEHHYGEHKDKPFFADLIGYITSGPVVAMIIAGEDAVRTVRAMCGATKVEEALPGTIRGDFAGATTKNVIHASDAAETAEREIDIFFEPEEIIEYDAGNTHWVY